MRSPEASPPPPIGTTSCLELADLLGDLEPERPLAGDDDRVLERMDEGGARLDARSGGHVRLVEPLAGENTSAP